MKRGAVWPGLGGCGCSGISTALGIQAGQLILLAPLCNAQTQTAFPTRPDRPPPALKIHTLASLTRLRCTARVCFNSDQTSCLVRVPEARGVHTPSLKLPVGHCLFLLFLTSSSPYSVEARRYASRSVCQ